MRRFGLAPPDFDSSDEPRSLADVLRWRAGRSGEDRVLTFLADGETPSSGLTFGELDLRARRAAALLLQHDCRSRPVLLLVDPGPDFLVAFLGCLYAGAIAVPVYPPDVKRLSRTLPRLLAVVEDCGADIVLTTATKRAASAALFELAPTLASRVWLTVDDTEGGLERAWRDPGVLADELAFIQYTSGSTGNPKGVEVTHRSLLLNLSMLGHLTGSTKGETTVTWLPSYHDMGLIDGWLRPVFVGSHGVAMAPSAFLKRPFHWLKALSRFRGTVSGGPNFAYELCASKVSDAELEELDLRGWRMAYCAAEPVRAQTLRRFTERFERCGFRPEAFSPGYGLAEAGLVVSGNGFRTPPTILPIRSVELENHHVILSEAKAAAVEAPDIHEAVGVGPPAVELLIVDPETRRPVPRGRVGEIWLSGPSLARGYWRNPDATVETFEARLESGAGPYLRTGDLGFQRPDDDELFVCGRRKDLIIIRGRNLYPQDIEQTVEEVDPAILRPGCNAAFSIERDGGEKLVVVQEVQRRFHDETSEWRSRRLPNPELETFAPTLTEPPEFDKMIESIRGAVSEAHGVDPFAVVLVKAGSIPKTSSGKIQRRACRDGFEHRTLEVVKAWKVELRPSATSPLATGPAAAPSDEHPSQPKLRTWLRGALASRLGLGLSQLDDHRPFAAMGLDSQEAVSLVGDLERELGSRLPPSLLYDHPTVDRLVQHLEAHPPLPTPVPTAATHDPVAIIGIGCRLPGADSPAELWRLLVEGKDAMSEVPPERRSFFELPPAGPAMPWPLRGGFVRHIEAFDRRPFDLTAREAARMDPQQRWLLEVTAEALESAGLLPSAYAGSRTGVFVGISSFDHARRLLGAPDGVDAYDGTGGALSIAANRISYQLDLRGPSVAIDSACSSSLVATHLAIASLRRGECDLAIVGGVNAILSPQLHLIFAQAGLLAGDGACKPFDARADGITRSEGAVAIVLKPWSRALADGDHVWATLLGSAVNSDGRSNGLMAPNGSAQRAVLREAYRDAGVEPSRVQYVEAHGTGTALGDPIEVEALGDVAGHGRAADQPCRLGSVKSNLGHLEAAAGLAGLVKVALSLHHRELVPSIHFEAPNPRIPFARLGMRVQTAHEPWPGVPGSRLAGVSAFGFGGTNAHVVVADAKRRAVEERTVEERTVRERPRLIPLSARSTSGLERLAQDYRRLLADDAGEVDLARLAHTTALRRVHRAHRLTLVARSSKELDEQLCSFLSREHRPTADGPMLADGARTVVFVFPGQGGQRPGMGRELLENQPVFRAAIEEYDLALRPLFGWSLLEELKREPATSRVHQIEFTHPLLFAVQAGLFRLWCSLGVRPAAVVGHSLGEITAAYVAGKLELDEAARVLFHRGRLMATARGHGAMAAVSLSLEEASRMARDEPGRLHVAASNAPSSCVVAGDQAAVARLIERLTGRGVFARALQVEVAAHSPQMEPLTGPLSAAIGAVPFRASELPIVSTVTGASADEVTFDGAYWARNLRETVRFQAAIEHLLGQGHRTFLELGPQPVLQSAIAEVGSLTGARTHALFSLRHDQSEEATFLGALGQLWTLGFSIDWRRLSPSPLVCLPLPTTPWDRERCWIDLAPRPSASAPRDHALVSGHTESPAENGTHTFSVELGVGAIPWAGDHRVQGEAVFPATGILELMRAAAARALGDWRAALQNVRFERALILPETSSREGAAILKAGARGAPARFELHSRSSDAPESGWTLHATGEIRPGVGQLRHERLDLAAIAARCTEVVTPEAHYRACLERGLDYRGTFQSVREIHRRDGEALGRVALTGDSGGYHVHPGLLDSCLQVIASTAKRSAAGEAETYLPVAIDELVLTGAPGAGVMSHAVLSDTDPPTPEVHRADVTLADEDGRVWGELRGLLVRRLDALGITGEISPWHYQLEWEPETQRRPVESSDGDDDDAGTWLVFADRRGLGAALAQALRDRRWPVVTVAPGPSFREVAPGCFELDPHDPSSLGRVLEGRATTEAIARVVYLWGLDDDDAQSALSPEALLTRVTGGCDAVIRVVQALVRSGREPLPALWLVTRLAQSTSVAEAPRALIGSALWGLGRSLALEHPELWGGLLDLDDGAGAEAVLSALTETRGEDQLAVRGGARLVPRLVHRPLEHRTADPAVAQANTPLHLSPDATYLITGGLGTVGRSLCRWLLDRGARTILLTGRRPIPEGTDLEALAAWGGPAARVHYAVADVADHEAMERALSGPGLPPLRGVFHAAGVVTPRPVLETTRESIAAELSSKVAGAWVLHQLTERQPLDFFVVFSSAAAIWGSKLLSTYGAANHFMDALIEWRHGRGLKGLSVNWAMWGGGGMTASADAALQRLGLRPMSPKRALAALEALLLRGQTRAVVADVDWGVFKPLYEQVPRRRLLEHLEQPPPAKGGAPTGGPSLAATLRAMTEPEARQAAVRDFVVEQVAAVLGIPKGQLELGKSLLAQGLDSLNASDLRGRLSHALPIEVNLLSLLRGDSPLGLSDRISEQLASAQGATPTPAPLRAPGLAEALEDDALAALGIFRIIVPVPYAEASGPVNAFAISNEDGTWTLFDSGVGTPEGLQALEEGAKASGVDLDRVTRVVVSHGHVDHFGNARALAERSGARIWVHPGDAAKLSGAQRYTDLLRGHRDYLLRLGASPEVLDGCAAALERGPVVARFLDEASLERLEGGARFRFRHFEATAMHAPGHTPGLVCLYAAPQKLLLSGDHLLPWATPSPLLDLSQGSGDTKFLPLVRYLESARGTYALELDCVLPGHGPAFRGHRRVLDGLFEFYRGRQEKLLRLVKETPATITALLEALSPRPDPSRFLLRLSEVLANVEVLEREGLVERRLMDGAWRFHARDQKQGERSSVTMASASGDTGDYTGWGESTRCPRRSKRP